MSATVVLLAEINGKPSISTSKRVYLGLLPQGAKFPAITITSVSGAPRNTVSMLEPNRIVRERVQVTVYAKTYKELDELMRATTRSIKNKRGEIAGMQVQSIIPAGTGPDLEGVNPVMLARSADYFVTYLT